MLTIIGTYIDESGSSWSVYRDSNNNIVLADSADPEDIHSPEWIYGEDTPETRSLLQDELMVCDCSVEFADSFPTTTPQDTSNPLDESFMNIPF